MISVIKCIRQGDETVHFQKKLYKPYHPTREGRNHRWRTHQGSQDGRRFIDYLETPYRASGNSSQTDWLKMKAPVIFYLPKYPPHTVRYIPSLIAASR